MVVSIRWRLACWKIVVLLATMLWMLVAFACFVIWDSIIYGVLVPGAFAKLANKFLSPKASMKGIVVTNPVIWFDHWWIHQAIPQNATPALWGVRARDSDQRRCVNTWVGAQLKNLSIHPIQHSAWKNKVACDCYNTRWAWVQVWLANWYAFDTSIISIYPTLAPKHIKVMKFHWYPMTKSAVICATLGPLQRSRSVFGIFDGFLIMDVIAPAVSRVLPC